MKLKTLISKLEHGMIIRLYDDYNLETILCNFHDKVSARLKVYGDYEVNCINCGDDDCDIEIVITVK